MLVPAPRTQKGAHNLEDYTQYLVLHAEIIEDIKKTFGNVLFDRIGSNYYFADAEVAVYVRLRYS